MLYTRRDVGRIALAALPATQAFGAKKINSKIRGIQIGAITYSFGGMTMDECIHAFVDIGLGEMELMSATAETAAGLPSPTGGGAGRGAGARGAGWSSAEGPGGGAGARDPAQRGAGRPAPPERDALERERDPPRRVRLARR